MILEQVDRTLRVRGAEFCGETHPPRHIEVVRLSPTALRATLVFADRARRVVVKKTANNTYTTSPRALAAMVATLGSLSPALAAALPRVLGVDEAQGLLVLSYVEGRTLKQRLMAALRHRSAAHDVDPLLRQAARLLTVLAELPYDSILPAMRPTSYHAFADQFESLATPFASVFASAGLAPTAFLERLPVALFERKADRLLLVDFRPKNIVVDADGRLFLVDLDFTYGPPGLGVAVFLVAVDKYGPRDPRPATLAQLDAWKRTFLSAYRQLPGACPSDEIVFFYVWNLLEAYRHHVAARPWFRVYLRWFYGRRLAQCLRNLQRHALADVLAAPERLFEGA